MSIIDIRAELLGDLLVPVREAAPTLPAGLAELAEATTRLRRDHPTLTEAQIEYILRRVEYDHASDHASDLPYVDAVRAAAAAYAKSLPAKTADTQNAAALDTILDSGRR